VSLGDPLLLAHSATQSGLHRIWVRYFLAYKTGAAFQKTGKLIPLMHSFKLQKTETRCEYRTLHIRARCLHYVDVVRVPNL
jgi:hypothetical protein